MNDDRSVGVIYVEDDEDVRIGGVQALELAGFSVSGFASVEAASPIVRPDMPFVVVCDVRLRGKSGTEWLSDLRRLDSDIPVILITGHGDISMAVQAMRDGAYDFIEKPCSSEQLVSVVRRAAEKRRLTLEVRALRSALADRQGIEASLLGRSPQIQEVRRLVSTLASTNVDVTRSTAKPAPARTLSRAASTITADAAAAITFRSIAGACPNRWSRASCSGTRLGHSPVPSVSASERSNTPMAGRCFSTKSKACR
jgi:two-component system C4-dicarboxylate transport response regulator DctD